MFLSDLQSNTIKQVTIENNGTILKGTVVTVMSLEQGALPYGISVTSLTQEMGGLIQFDLSNGNSNVVVENLY